MATRTTPSIGEAAQSYLEDRDDLSEKSHKAHRLMLARFVRFTPDKQVGRLTWQDTESFMRALKRGDVKAGCRPGHGGLGSEAMEQARMVLKAFVAYCHRRSWCKGDLMDGVRKAAPDPRRDFLRLTADELSACLDACDHPRDRVLLAAAMNTGLRSSEIIALQLQHFDLSHGEIYTTIFKGKVSDYVPITADLDTELRRWLTFYEAECGPFNSSTGHYFMFPAKRPDYFTGKIVDGKRQQDIGPLKPTSKMSQPQLVAIKALKAIGYSDEALEREGLHTFRRSVARIYFDLAAQESYSNALEETAALLHHKSMRTTELYLGLDAGKHRRDGRLKGKPFISAMTSKTDNVTPLRPASSE